LIRTRGRSLGRLRQLEEENGKLKKIVAARVCYGYRRIQVLLRREGWAVNTKRVYRAYREMGLQLRNWVEQIGVEIGFGRVVRATTRNPPTAFQLTQAALTQDWTPASTRRVERCMRSAQEGWLVPNRPSRRWAQNYQVPIDVMALVN
jgi:hypothetical protein